METVKEEVERWVGEGWRFRIKRVKTKPYITRHRKGKERSLGPYSDELWNSIKSVPGAVAKPRSKPLNLEVEALKGELSGLQEHLEAISILLPKTVHGKKWWLFTKIALFTRQIKAMKRRISKVEERTLDPVLLRLLNVENKLRRLDKLERNLNDFEDKLVWLERSVEMRFRVDTENICIHNKDGYCTYWSCNSEVEGWSMRKLIDGRYQLKVEDHKLLCASCPNYSKKSKLQTIEDKERRAKLRPPP